MPHVLALRRLTLADPKFQNRAAAIDLDDFFTATLNALIEDFSFERLQELAPEGFAPMLPPGDHKTQAEDREIVQKLTRHLFV